MSYSTQVPIGRGVSHYPVFTDASPGGEESAKRTQSEGSGTRQEMYHINFLELEEVLRPFLLFS